jgi:hypothetical protein
MREQEARRRKCHGRKAAASATEERTLKGNPREASSRDLQPSRLSEPGKKAL